MTEILGASIAVSVPGELPDTSSIITIQRDDRPDIPYPGRWEVPGGTCEGEPAALCALRELEEEVGVALTEEDIVWRALYPSARVPGAYNAYFVARMNHRPELRLGGEGRACRLMPYGEFALSGAVIIDHVDRYHDYLHNIGGYRRHQNPTHPERGSMGLWLYQQADTRNHARVA